MGEFWECSQHLSRHFSNVPAQASFFRGRPQGGALAFCTVLPGPSEQLWGAPAHGGHLVCTWGTPSAG